jgi:hypothetical protein
LGAAVAAVALAGFALHRFGDARAWVYGGVLALLALAACVVMRLSRARRPRGPDRIGQAGGLPSGGSRPSRPERPAAPAPAAKVGRNDPCPCGSGEKYKRCCGLG